MTLNLHDTRIFKKNLQSHFPSLLQTKEKRNCIIKILIRCNYIIAMTLFYYYMKSENLPKGIDKLDLKIFYRSQQ